MTNANSTRPWPLRSAEEKAVEHLSTSLEISPITARVLAGRGITDEDEARRFLEPKLNHIPDPFTLPDMEKAVDCILETLERGNRIAIFGDYDVDGVTASALLTDFLTAIDHEPIVLLPERQERGYGIDAGVIEKLSAEGVKLIITVDNGIRAVEAARRARELGIDLVITDHHIPDGELPEAAAIVNPKLIEEESTLKQLSGCGVAFMLALALRKRLREKGNLPSPEPNLRAQLDIVTLGTIADIMPLTGINRVLTSFGLEELTRARRIGLRALLNVSGAWPSDITPGIVAFRIAPRINAAGRMGSARRAFDLLLTEDEEAASEMARVLDRANRERQKIEEKALRSAIRTIDALDTIPEGIVVGSEGWHVGVIGIVAAKLVERYGRPSVVITKDLEPARGSARSPDDVDLMDVLSPCADLLEQYGGHAQAAGLSVKAESMDEFARRFAEACERTERKGPSAKISIDSFICSRDITDELVTELSRCAPFGVGNPEPVLAFKEASIVDTRTVGNGHLKLTLNSEGCHFDGIGFNMASRVPEGLKEISVAFTPQYNTWNGRTSIQLKVKDIVPA